MPNMVDELHEQMTKMFQDEIKSVVASLTVKAAKLVSESSLAKRTRSRMSARMKRKLDELAVASSGAPAGSHDRETDDTDQTHPCPRTENFVADRLGELL